MRLNVNQVVNELRLKINPSRAPEFDPDWNNLWSDFNYLSDDIWIIWVPFSRELEG
jgi:hypothetical protein